MREILFAFVSDTNKNEGIIRIVCERVVFVRQTRYYILYVLEVTVW
jgi:hypothetical protein